MFVSTVAHPKANTCLSLVLYLIFIVFPPFNCCLTLRGVLQLNKGAYPENWHVVFCPNSESSHVVFCPNSESSHVVFFPNSENWHVVFCPNSQGSHVVFFPNIQSSHVVFFTNSQSSHVVMLSALIQPYRLTGRKTPTYLLCLCPNTENSHVVFSPSSENSHVFCPNSEN